LKNFKLFLEQTEEQADVIEADIPLPDTVHALSKLFKNNGEYLYVVGGAVRDYLFSIWHKSGSYSPKDVDLATQADPDKVQKILNSSEAKNLGIKSFPKGESFGVISAVFDRDRWKIPDDESVEYEIATFREEEYSQDGDGRRPDKVSFSTPKKDSARRDIYMNALYYRIDTKQIMDFNVDENGKGQGFEDIRNKAVRPVGNARERFREDKLRIPRLIRFFSRYNPNEILDHLDRNTILAIKEFKDLQGVSPERISAEFLSGLAKAINIPNYLKNYQILDLLPTVFPGLKVNLDFGKIGTIRNPKAILAWILKDNDPKTVEASLNNLKYSSAIFSRVKYLLDLYRFNPEKVHHYLKTRDLYKQEKDQGIHATLKNEVEKDILDFGHIAEMPEMNKFVKYQPTVKSQDFMHLKGKEISTAMAAAERDNYNKNLDHLS
jgi:tRNA nucleotidyltransferase/poly(A) polymerase